MNWFLNIPNKKDLCELMTNDKYEGGVTYVQVVLKRGHFNLKSESRLNEWQTPGLRHASMIHFGLLGAAEKAQHQQCFFRG